MPIVIERERSASALDDHPHEEKVALGILLRAKAQGEQFPGCVINRRE